MSSSVPSVEPLSTTTTSWPRTESRQRSTQGSALNVTTTTVTSATVRQRRARAAIEDVLPEDHGDAGEREHDRHHEEQEPARERLVGVHAKVSEEVDEERLAHADPVDG